MPHFYLHLSISNGFVSSKIYDKRDDVDFLLAHDVAVIQWITSCHKKHTTTRLITLWRVSLTSLTLSVSTLCFVIEIILILKAIKSYFKIIIIIIIINRILHEWSIHMKIM